MTTMEKLAADRGWEICRGYGRPRHYAPQGLAGRLFCRRCVATFLIAHPPASPVVRALLGRMEDMDQERRAAEKDYHDEMRAAAAELRDRGDY